MMEIKKLYEYLENPEYATQGSVGLDLRACTFNGNDLQHWDLLSNTVVMIGTGIQLNMTEYSEPADTFDDNVGASIGAIVLPRSGLGSKHGIVLGNLVGLIDNDYQGEIIVSLWNRSVSPFVINKLDRIAQLCFVPFLKPEFKFVKEFSNDTARGSGGFGSTGKE